MRRHARGRRAECGRRRRDQRLGVRGSSGTSSSASSSAKPVSPPPPPISSRSARSGSKPAAEALQALAVVEAQLGRELVVVEQADVVLPRGSGSAGSISMRR